jgi:hypothetical protein|eukprot:COSAG06_NODE_2414_length_6916_cov_66.899956_6_plen_112_part_00
MKAPHAYIYIVLHIDLVVLLGVLPVYSTILYIAFRSTAVMTRRARATRPRRWTSIALLILTGGHHDQAQGWASLARVWRELTSTQQLITSSSFCITSSLAVREPPRHGATT